MEQCNEWRKRSDDILFWNKFNLLVLSYLTACFTSIAKPSRKIKYTSLIQQIHITLRLSKINVSVPFNNIEYYIFEAVSCSNLLLSRVNIPSFDKRYDYGDVNMTSQHFIVCLPHLYKDRCGIASQHAKVSLTHNGPFSILGQCSTQPNWTHKVYIKVLDGLKSSARLGTARVGLKLQADPSGFISIQKTKQLQLQVELFIKNSNCQPLKA